ncbi:MAG: diguanylate cyclase [Azoarcus sp.]|nr:diguanylate cyclase [Azoarcus sp.]
MDIPFEPVRETLLETPLRLLLASVLANGTIPLVEDDESLVREIRSLSDELLSAEPVRSDFSSRLEQVVSRMERLGPEHLAMRKALLDLLRLIVTNIRELVVDDSWLHEQLSAIAGAFSGSLSLRVIDAVGQQLREVIDKQSRLKRELTEAQARLKALLAGFIDRLSEVTGTTGEYQELLDRSARRIGEASNIADLSEVVGELVLGTHQTKELALRTGQELTELREQVNRANREIARLQRELDTASRLVSHDPLTGVLNRKGLAEALKREISRARRNGSPLCVALIDVDDFKNVNDVYGHGVGDEVLCHLARTLTETLRPQDVVARYGGEEFVILLPDTVPDAASSILKRLQRELACRVFYAHDSELLPVTFSAGIARFSPEEDLETALSRADAAMYAAKRAGKNRVCTKA